MRRGAFSLVNSGKCLSSVVVGIHVKYSNLPALGDVAESNGRVDLYCLDL